ncbi:hypothetical protein P12x_004165 [Tundrisphaera lichenicola]|uniref:hypothetical protein n=1 Tax=Tundrisphaera lichenicola TaxID=2029860 RepID=UPI003EB88ED6
MGPERRVVDQVCLVGDIPAFFEAISTWDRGHAFPILFDDVESSFRFIRAFKPARVIRFVGTSAPIAQDKIWDRAVAAVGASWSEPDDHSSKTSGIEVPRSIGATPPGVILSSPEASMLAGAVALAAGRFQPLLRFDSSKKYSDVLSFEDFLKFDLDLTSKIQARIPRYDTLGDDCDFITLAGDWPYRYLDSNREINAVDDRLARSVITSRRWGYAGRIIGNAPESVYQAMCSLFLQPESAVMFNGYDEKSPPWSDYATREAATRLSASLPTSQISGDREAGIDGWHDTFDPDNQHGLVLINSHGMPRVFNLRSGPACAADIPRGVPSAVLMIHSYSAADPADPFTIAGRWLANGAFLYFGSVNEPYLDAFRTPRLVGNLISEKLPIVVAVRKSLNESRGLPWRLIFLGDPLYRLSSIIKPEPRLTEWERTSGWPAYEERPFSLEWDDNARFLWALKTSIARLTRDPGPEGQPSPDEILLGVNREKLVGSYRPVYEALLVELLLQSRKRGLLRSKIASIPEAERSPSLCRAFETIEAIEFTLVMATQDFTKARQVWVEMIRSNVSQELKEQSTPRLGKLANSPFRRAEWAESLRLILRERSTEPEALALASELKRVEKAIQNEASK